MLVIDYVLYNGEPIIEFRLKYLYKHVDIFIIVESMFTHSGNKKNDLYYKINKDIFKDYEDKIQFYQIENLATGDDYLNILINNILYERKNSWVNEVYSRDYIQKKLLNFNPFIMFVCDVDEIPKRELYVNIKTDYDLLHEGAHLEMLLLNYGFKWKKENYIWRHPFVISDKGFNSFSLSNVRLTRTTKQYKNAGWHVSYCFEIDDIIRKFESSAHTENNREIYKDKDYLLKCIKEGKNILKDKEQFVETEDNELPDEYKPFQDKINNFYL
jgi:beta-1,4-mannosyl-glycoprotein beta-1,4-N-acetylglucosaminyltransferase